MRDGTRHVVQRACMRMDGSRGVFVWTDGSRRSALMGQGIRRPLHPNPPQPTTPHHTTSLHAPASQPLHAPNQHPAPVTLMHPSILRLTSRRPANAERSPVTEQPWRSSTRIRSTDSRVVVRVARGIRRRPPPWRTTRARNESVRYDGSSVASAASELILTCFLKPVRVNPVDGGVEVTRC